MKRYLILALFLVLGGALAAPSLSLSYEVAPTSVNAGGTAQVIVNIVNADLTTDVDKLEMTLTSKTSGMVVISGYANPGTVSAGSTTSAAFAVKASQSAAPGTYVLEAKGSYEYGSGDTSVFRLSIPIIVTYRSTLGIFAPDTQITPGATGNLIVTLNNAGRSPIRDVVMTLSSGSSYVYAVGNVRSSIEVVQAGTSSEVNFVIRASDTATVGIQPMNVTVTYTDAGGSTQTDTQGIGITVVDAGTEVVVDSIESNLESGKTGTVKIGVKNVGSVDLNNLYLSITTGAELSISGANERMIESLAVGETKYVEFGFDVSQDAEAKPVASTLSVKYQRDGGKKQITAEKSIGIAVSGSVDLQLIKVSVDKANRQIEVDVANYGNKAADAVKVEALQGDKSFGSGFTDTIKPNKHKVFRFDMPTSRDITIRMSYKDYATDGGEKVVEQTHTFSESEVAPPAGDGTGMMVVLVLVALAFLWWWRKRGMDRIKIDISKYKEK
jgi:hypothetical protein